MEPFDPIIEQLNEQNIKYEILQDSYTSLESELSKVVKDWEEQFIGNKMAPQLDHYLWHIFSNRATNSIVGKDAECELRKQPNTDTLIFNEARQYLIRCVNQIPEIAMDDFNDDIYLSNYDMQWTYVIPHEVHNGIGPYFSYGDR